MKLPAIAVASLAVLLHAVAGIAQPEETPQVSVYPIKGPLHLLRGKGGNVVASVGKDGVLLVDGDYAEYAQAYRQAITHLTAAGQPARFLLNTHWHSDHTGGNKYWGEQRSIIIAHDNVRARMSTRQDMKALGKVVEPSPELALPLITFADSMALHFNGDDIEVRHFPTGHTDGDSVVFFTAQNVVHMGDHYWTDAFPFVDIDSGGNVFGYIANVEDVLQRVDDDTVIVPGHGESLGSKKDLEGFHTMLVVTSGIVKEALDEGQTVAQITERGLGKQWASYGQGFINEKAWISFIAGSL